MKIKNLFSHRNMWTLLFTGLVSYPSASSGSPVISVYTTNAYPIFHQEHAHQIYYLDAVEQIENDLSQGFSNDPQIAIQQAKSLFTSPEWQAQETNLKNAYIGLISGWQNGIKKAPAVLFESASLPVAVIYGEPDIIKAKSLWQQWTLNRGQKQ